MTEQKTLKQCLEDNLVFENPNTKPITKAVAKWLTQKRQETYERYPKTTKFRIETYNELLEGLQK